MKITVSISDQKIFASASDCHTVWDGAALQIYQDDDEQTEALFAYAMRPGQYAKVQVLDSETVVRINE